MSSDVSYFTQDYWMNSLAIGHPLVYHSQANKENAVGAAPAMDDNYVRFIYNLFKHKLTSYFRPCSGTRWIWQSMRQICK